MHTELQSAILAALRARHPEAMTEIEIWEQVSKGQIATTTVYIACVGLEKAGLIVAVENGKKWKLTDTEGVQSSQGNVGQMVGADRKPLSPNQDQVSQPTRASGLGAAASASAGSYGEAAPCTETAGAGEILSAQDGPSVALSTYIGGNAGVQGGADCQAPFQIQDAPLREAAESSQSGHGFAPSPAHSGETESCGDNLHAFPGNGDAVSLPAGLSDFESGLSATPAKGTQCEKSCSTVEGHGTRSQGPRTDSSSLPIDAVAERIVKSGGDDQTEYEPPYCLRTVCPSSEYQASPTGLKCFRRCEPTADRRLCADNSGLTITVCLCECHDKFGEAGPLELDSQGRCNGLPEARNLASPIQIGAEAATDGDHSTCYGSTPSRAETLCADDVPQPLSAESMSCGERAATGKDGSRAASRKADGTLGNETRQDCGPDEVESLIPQVSSIPDGAEGDDRAAGLDLLSPEFHAVHIADEGANSTRAWWGELEREAQEAIAGEMVANERWR